MHRERVHVRRDVVISVLAGGRRKSVPRLDEALCSPLKLIDLFVRKAVRLMQEVHALGEGRPQVRNLRIKFKNA
jgi:hypothetical protein